MLKMKYIEVKNPPIRLGQFLKLANLVQDGVEAKIRIQDGEVMVNSTVETRRGRQILEGDTITYNGQNRTVRIAPPSP